jgi:Gpi18-like mannosyltransferase
MRTSRKDFHEQWLKSLIFIILLWLSSRMLIVAAMLLIAPTMPSSHHVVGWGACSAGGFPSAGIWRCWEVFTRWDGLWYQKIANFGYEYAHDSRAHSVAFFPMFPLISKVIMVTGLPFAIAGTLANNVAFLITLVVVYRWVTKLHGIEVARWTVAYLVWCPLSLYGTVAYTEGLFLLLSTLSLQAFDQNRYVWASIWGALTTATRLNGTMLIPTFLFLAYKERRGINAYITAAATSIGFLLYTGYCAIQFGDPLAFLHTQAGFGHRSSASIDWRHWGLNFIYGVFGPVNWDNWLPKNLSHPVQFVVICTGGYLLWRYRFQLNHIAMSWIGFILLVWLWLLWGDGFVKTYMVFGGGFLLWYFRHELRSVVITYGVFSLWLVLFSGSIVANERFAFGIVSLAIAMGMLLSRFKSWRLPILIYFAIVLASFAIRFSRNIWVA